MDAREWLTGGSEDLGKMLEVGRARPRRGLADAASVPPAPNIKPNLQLCLEHCLKKVTACLEICKALPSSKN